MWRLLLFEFILVLVVVGVWLLAPLVGIKSVLWRVLIIVGLVLPPILYLIYKLVARRKAARGLESEIKQQGRVHQDSVRPDRQEDIKVLNDAFGQAIGALKKSNLGGRGAALYALPWYMIIGPPAVGKSTALIRSGLKFPFTTGDRKAIRGVGGTRNCDWWFSDQAILLDTAGRYTSEDEDLDEWTAFLRMLRKYRRKRPLNGLIVAVAISDLLTNDGAEIEDMANQIRSRVDQVINELNLVLPIYVLFTKCDLISGFVEYFGDLKKSTRSQILGFTVPLTNASTNIEELIGTEFDTLLGRLRRRCFTRIGSAKPAQRPSIFQFPLQFATAKDPIQAFMQQLLISNPYQETPRLRGVYFCSGTQEGRPVDRVMATVGQALGLRATTARSMEERSTKKSYFLRDVFTEVMIPDKSLAGTTRTGRSKRRKLGLAIISVAAILAAGVLGASAMTFGNNRGLLNSTAEMAKKSRITTPDDPRKVTETLRVLERFGTRIDLLGRYAKEGHPWKLGLGYYKGENLIGPATKVYVKRMWRSFVRPVGSELEATLTDIAATNDQTAKDADKDFDLLKTYLMVTNKDRLEIDFAANVLLTQWKKRLHPDVAAERELLLSNAKRYLQLIKEGKAGWLDRDEDLIRSVRQALKSRDAEYLRVIGNVNKKLQPFQLKDALRGKIQNVLRGKHKVPAAYTREGWRLIRKRLVTEAASGSKVEPWVLGEDATENAAKRIKERYYDQYIEAWLRFLAGLSINEPKDAKGALASLEAITGSPSLYKLLLRSIKYNTEMPLVEVGKVPNMRLPGKLGKVVTAAKRAKRAGIKLPPRKLNRVEKYFERAWFLVDPKEIAGQKPISGIDQYLAQLAQVQTTLAATLKKGKDTDALDRVVTEGQRIARGVLASVQGKIRSALGPLLLRPLDLAIQFGNSTVAQQGGEAFKNFLCASFAETLAGRYPFSNTKRDSSLQDVVAFFAPGGTVWSYYDQNLSSQLVLQGSSYRPRQGKKVSAGIVRFLNRAKIISRALFSVGSNKPQVRYEVRPKPAILAEGENFRIAKIVLEADGKEKVYRNGPVEQWALEWTGRGGRSRLLVTGEGVREQITAQGEWSLRRLIKRGKVRKRGSWYQVEWKLRNGKIRIQMDFRPARTYNPLFTNLRLSCRASR